MASEQVKVVVLGDAGVGKTSILTRFVKNEFSGDREATKGGTFWSKSVDVKGSKTKINFQIWDTAGQEIYRSMASLYYKDAGAAILVYDITNRGSFEAIHYWARELELNCGKNIVVMIAGNKADLIEKEEISISLAQSFAQQVGAIFTQTSAKENLGIDQVFSEIALKMKGKEIHHAHGMKKRKSGTSKVEKEHNEDGILQEEGGWHGVMGKTSKEPETNKEISSDAVSVDIYIYIYIYIARIYDSWQARLHSDNKANCYTEKEKEKEGRWVLLGL